MRLIFLSIFTILLQYLIINPAFAAFPLVKAYVANGYKDCRLKDNGNGTSTAWITIDFRDAEGATNGAQFASRAMLFYTYSKTGVAINTTPLTWSMGESISNQYYEGIDYIILHGNNNNSSKPWKKAEAFITDASVTFNNSVFTDWPAVSIRAGNAVYGRDVADIKGGAYVSAGADGKCQILVEPSNPPPPDVSLTVTAPDWDLGEIKRGQRDIPFTARQDQFCLKYSNLVTDGKQFIIQASAQNGTVNNQFLLKGLQNNTQTIPYQLTLDSGQYKFTLPGPSLNSIPLSAGGETCFLPTFRTFTPKDIEKGDYSDVLTFDIVTKT